MNRIIIIESHYTPEHICHSWFTDPSTMKTTDSIGNQETFNLNARWWSSCTVWDSPCFTLEFYCTGTICWPNDSVKCNSGLSFENNPVCQSIPHLPFRLSTPPRNCLEVVIYDHWLYVTPTSTNNYSSPVDFLLASSHYKSERYVIKTQ